MKNGILTLQGLMMIFVAAAAFSNIGRFDDPEFFSLPLTWVGATLEASGFVICMTAIFTLRWQLTWKVDPRHKLVSNGIFRWTRNPIYLGGLVMSCGWTLIFHSYLCALSSLGLAIVLNIKIRMEERALSEKFGTDYVEYQKRTRRWL